MERTVTKISHRPRQYLPSLEGKFFNIRTCHAALKFRLIFPLTGMVIGGFEWLKWCVYVLISIVFGDK